MEANDKMNSIHKKCRVLEKESGEIIGPAISQIKSSDISNFKIFVESCSSKGAKILKHIINIIYLNIGHNAVSIADSSLEE